MEYVKQVNTQDQIDYNLTSMKPGKRRSFRLKYETAENLIKKCKVDQHIVDYIIQECYKNNLSLNQTAVVLAHAFAESSMRPNVTNKWGFHGLWQFSKGQVKRFNLHNSLEKQVQYLMEEIAQKNELDDYKTRWISWHKQGNGWISKHKQTWDTSDLLFDLNRAFSYGWERFAIEGKGINENLARYELSQMFKEYLINREK